MLISEFLNTDQLEEIENGQVEELIIECLSKIHIVYNDGVISTTNTISV